jgi:hypothetical protein
MQEQSIKLKIKNTRQQPQQKVEVVFMPRTEKVRRSFTNAEKRQFIGKRRSLHFPLLNAKIGVRQRAAE